MQQNLSKNIIKGKIAEVIFELMFREGGKNTVIPFGYEKTFPELLYSYKSSNKGKRGVMKNIKNAPDYAIISEDKKSIYLVEVKYRAKFDENEIRSIAKDQEKRWSPSYMFVATLGGFYFGMCQDIVKSGKISKLAESMVGSGLQEKYLKLLGDFEK